MLNVSNVVLCSLHLVGQKSDMYPYLLLNTIGVELVSVSRLHEVFFMQKWHKARIEDRLIPSSVSTWRAQGLLDWRQSSTMKTLVNPKNMFHLEFRRLKVDDNVGEFRSDLYSRVDLSCNGSRSRTGWHWWVEGVVFSDLGVELNEVTNNFVNTSLFKQKHIPLWGSRLHVYWADRCARCWASPAWQHSATLTIACRSSGSPRPVARTEHW